MILVVWGLILSVFWFSVCSLSPMALTIMLILYSAVLGTLTWMTLSKWLMMAIFLIFLGGMMIIFMYAVTLVPNNKLLFYFNKPVMVAIGLLAWVYGSKMLYFPNVEMDNVSSEMFIPLTRTSIFMLTLYLLLTLVSIVKISQGFKGALSKMF